MTGLLIKVEHHPESAMAWYASMYRDLGREALGGIELISGMGAWADTRENAIAACSKLYEASQEAEPVEWLTYAPSEIEPQSLKAV